MNWILKKILPLLLSVTMAAGMTGVPVLAAVSAGQENGITEYAADDAIFTVKVDDGPEASYQDEADFGRIWESVQGKKAEICLLKNLDLDHTTFNDQDKHLILESGNVTLKMARNVKLSTADAGPVIWITDGTFRLEGSGTLEGDDFSELCTGEGQSGGVVLQVDNGSVHIQNVKLTGGYCITMPRNKADVNVEFCKFESQSQAVDISVDEMYVNDILANGFAYQEQETDGSWKWITDGSRRQYLGSGSYQVRESPVKFSTHPEDETVIYDDVPNKLHAEAEITNQDALRSHDIKYQWYQLAEDGSWQAMGTEETSPDGTDFSFSGIFPAGTYQYRCKATCDWFSLYSDTAVVTVEPRPVTAEILGTGVKPYDGNTTVPDGLLSVRLNGILNSDIVSASAVFAYDSPSPGNRRITATITLNGRDSGNYVLDKETITVDGKIEGTEPDVPVTGLSLDRHVLGMTVGGRQKLTAAILPDNATDQNVIWTSNNPAVASVDRSGNVTAVSAGSAVITAATADGRFADSCQVTVTSSGSPGGSTGSIGSSGSAGNIYVNYKMPFLKDHPDKKGWSAIRAEAQKAAAGSGDGTLHIDMNGTVLVPGSFFTAVRDRDVTVVFDMDGGISWSVCGKDITAETFNDMNLSVRTGAGKIPKDILDGTAEGRAHLELSPAFSGPFGFTAVLTVQAGIGQYGIAAGTGDADAIAGMYANLFAYDPDRRSLEFVCADRIGNDGTAHLPAVRASDWTVIVSAYPMGGTDAPKDPSSPQNGTDSDNPQKPEESAKAQVKSVKLSKTVYTYNGKAKKPAVTAVDTDGRRISDKYYTVSYKNNVKAGKASAVIIFKDGYSGTLKKTFTIRPAGTSIKKTAPLSGGFSVKWAKRTVQTSGCQIQYSRNSGFKGNTTHSVFVKKASATKKTVKKLNTGKKYYVRIRTYKTVKTGGKNTNIYSVWSKAAALQVK